jgi:hypothetical protein
MEPISFTKYFWMNWQTWGLYGFSLLLCYIPVSIWYFQGWLFWLLLHVVIDITWLLGNVHTYRKYINIGKR